MPHMMHRRSLQLIALPFLFAFLTIFHDTAAAGTIRIETTTSVTVAGDALTVEVTTTNKGDVPAHNVQAHLMLLGHTQSSRIMGLLKQNEPETFVFEEPLSAVRKGRYPLAVLVDFHDANRYPFSAVSCATFYVKEDVNPNLACAGDDIFIQDSGELRFTIKNPGAATRSILATLVLPKELSSPKTSADFRIGIKQEEVVAFRINNFSALVGARYPVFCYFEYDSEETHYTALAEALVTIQKTKNWFQRTNLIWVIAAIILGAIIAAYQFKRKRP
jgi:hypothetical protein